jgi:hypothetical protein
MLGERMERNIMVDGKDKIDLKNKLNVGECKILEYRESKSMSNHNTMLNQMFLLVRNRSLRNCWRNKNIS